MGAIRMGAIKNLGMRINVSFVKYDAVSVGTAVATCSGDSGVASLKIWPAILIFFVFINIIDCH